MLAQFLNAVDLIAVERRVHGDPAAVLGHSFGEYAALVAANSLSVDSAVDLVLARGEAMEAMADGTTGMLAVIGLSGEVSLAHCGVDGLELAVSNSPRACVLAGARSAFVVAKDALRQAGASRTVELPIPVAAHTGRLAAVSAAVDDVLSRVVITRPRCPVFSATTGTEMGDPAAVRRSLVSSPVQRVDFDAAVRAALSAGHTDFREIGPTSPPALLSFVAETAADVGMADQITLGLATGGLRPMTVAGRPASSRPAVPERTPT